MRMLFIVGVLAVLAPFERAPIGAAATAVLIPQAPPVVRPLPEAPAGDQTRERRFDRARPRAATSSAPVITEDGTIETTLPDGSKRLTRPGVCGWTMVSPDGRRTTVACMQVRVATPPVPDDVTAAWLNAHSESLLNIARNLLGDNAEPSIGNYLRRYESGDPGVYEQISLRTSLIANLAR